MLFLVLNLLPNLRPRPLARPARFLAACGFTLILALSLVPGCQSRVVPVGADGQPASFVLGTLATDLGPEYDVLTIQAAAEQALLRRGYVITRRTSTQREARLTGEYAGGRDGAACDITVFNLHTGNRVQITVRPLGDLAESQSVMDATLAILGK